ncbi:flagellar hook-length control protein FliK [Luteibacter sp. UNCMF331Sha3.1]|uniref:flagellar hook-length control protein FliK n=1 Tax=Luteibacter sp. UNCMF331Sha3.1 TaxID=1502760 RepID=UPI0008B78BFE|nr:flagellar hook-length control protein FliK [Luteibacter sp. UNCMF331Sha3.1]SEM27519.1 flagellar hook-length control protein FliK [Luteibacter sp. UNCMF331Sha3.1]
MNNATLALQTARAAASPTQASPRPQDDASPAKRFDAALDAAHADARQPQRTSSNTAAADKSSAPAKAPAAKQATGDAKGAEKKDDATDADDALIAATMLSLIGVPPKVTEAATRVLGAAKEAATAPLAGVANVGSALASLLPGGATKPGEATLVPSSAVSGDPAAAATPAMAVANVPFSALLSAQAGQATPAKDDATASLDPASTSPMPLAHGQAPTHGVETLVQVQATQAAMSPQFAQELGDQIAWMGAGQIKEARIKLHPEELGSMDVRVNLDGGKVNVAIIAQHPAAVHAVQQTLSHLDTMLAHHGLSLGQADVGQGQAGQGGTGQGPAGSHDSGSPGDPQDVVATTRVSPRGLVDEVA